MEGLSLKVAEAVELRHARRGEGPIGADHVLALEGRPESVAVSTVPASGSAGITPC